MAIADVRQPLRIAARTVGRSPGWTLGVVLTLALGIGFATAVFTVAHALLIRPLPVQAQDRLAVLWGITRDGRTDHFPLLYRDALEYRRRARTLERVEFFAYGGAQAVPIRVGNGVVRLRRSLVSGGYFDLLGTRPLLGRVLRTEDDVQGAAPVAVLSYMGWLRYFGGDSSIIGRRMVVHYDDTPYTIVGVMPLGLDYPQGVDFWSPVVPNSGPLGDQPIYAELNVIGRLRAGTSINAAREELTRFFGTISSKRWGVTGVARTFTEDVVGDVGPAVLAFAAAAGLLLLITCINVANLLLMRGLARVRELAVRSALGAGRVRLIVQLLAESGILAVAGGVAGAALGAAAVRGFMFFAPAGTPRLDEIRMSGPVLIGAIAITTLAMLIFAVAPAIVTSRVDVQEALRSGTRQSSGSRRFRMASQALVVGQVALALLVLSAAGLLARSLLALERVDPEFDRARLLVAELAPPSDFMGNNSKQLTMMQQLVTRLEATPGVRSVTPVLTPPFAPVGGIFGRIPAEGQTPDEEAKNPAVTYELATPSYFTTFGIPLVRGRAFTAGDHEGTLPVVILSESLAQHYWPGVDPIGKRLVRGSTDRLTVVGVVRDTHYRDLRKPRPSLYIPLSQSIFPGFAPTTVIVATTGRPADMIPVLRQTLHDVDSRVALASATPFETLLAGTLAQPRLNALLLTLFAGAAMLLAAVGLFGTVATTVRQRTRELGVRLALGATPSLLRRGLLDQALKLALIGVGVGLAGWGLVSRFLRSLLFGVSATDPLALAGASFLLVIVAIAAAWRPAHRASRIDPVIALRAE
ncbi:MAG TPA: ABC transporter permease [Gemmatimonadaceae bacterium]|nr:ABC transporter permease [Gemmatimonadaceae bacterium]